jgi:hypothetical protein
LFIFLLVMVNAQRFKVVLMFEVVDDLVFAIGSLADFAWQISIKMGVHMLFLV